MRNLRQNQTDVFSFLRLPFRLARKAKFLVKGTPPLPTSQGLSGMDIFCLAQKGGFMV